MTKGRPIPAPAGAAAPDELLANALQVLTEMADAVASGADLTPWLSRREEMYARVQSVAAEWDPTCFDADAWRASLFEAEQRLAGVLNAALERTESEVVSQRRVRSAARQYQR